MSKKELLLIGFVIFAILLRLVPHPPNFAPITALALFAGINFKNKFIGVSFPLAAMFISDIFLGFSFITFWVYGAFVLIGIMSSFLNKLKLHNILLGSLIFFIVTNFGVWFLGYPKTLEGLILCYTLAIPFFINSILGDLFFSYLLQYSFKFTEQKLLKYDTKL